LYHVMPRRTPRHISLFCTIPPDIVGGLGTVVRAPGAVVVAPRRRAALVMPCALERRPRNRRTRRQSRPGCNAKAGGAGSRGAHWAEEPGVLSVPWQVPPDPDGRRVGPREEDRIGRSTLRGHESPTPAARAMTEAGVDISLHASKRPADPGLTFEVVVTVRDTARDAWGNAKGPDARRDGALRNTSRDAPHAVSTPTPDPNDELHHEVTETRREEDLSGIRFARIEWQVARRIRPSFPHPPEPTRQSLLYVSFSVPPRLRGQVRVR